MWDLVPWPGVTPSPLHWEWGVSASGPPGMSSDCKLLSIPLAYVHLVCGHHHHQMISVCGMPYMMLACVCWAPTVFQEQHPASGTPRWCWPSSCPQGTHHLVLGGQSGKLIILAAHRVVQAALVGSSTLPASCTETPANSLRHWLSLRENLQGGRTWHCWVLGLSLRVWGCLGTSPKSRRGCFGC